ncbi:MAG: hypothetical protein NVSMB3_11110 [Acidobacteriaceae bacterium]
MKVHQNPIRPKFSHRLQQLACTGSLAHDLQIPLLCEEAPEAPSHLRVIIGN